MTKPRIVQNYCQSDTQLTQVLQTLRIFCTVWRLPTAKFNEAYLAVILEPSEAKPWPRICKIRLVPAESAIFADMWMLARRASPVTITDAFEKASSSKFIGDSFELSGLRLHFFSCVTMYDFAHHTEICMRCRVMTLPFQFSYVKF